jgi:hypothetical protein
MLAMLGFGGASLARPKNDRNRRQRRADDDRRENFSLRPARQQASPHGDQPLRGVQAEGCTRSGKKCGEGKKLKPCSKCCTGYNITTRSKKKKCACRPDGIRCTQDAQCCAGVCFDRLCGALS